MSQQPVFDQLLLGVGAMKAGTTWVYDALNRHPDIQFSREKEIHFFYAQYVRPGLLAEKARMRRAKGHLAFDPEVSHIRALRDRVTWTAAYLDGPIDDAWFNGLFPRPAPGGWIADFSNLNALLPVEAWSAIAARTRRLRVLYTLREPLDRLWSHVRFHLKVNGMSDRLEAWSLDELEAHIRAGDYLEHSDYAGAIGRLRAGLPEECLHIDWFDRIGSDPGGFIADIEAFLGLAPNPLPEALMSRVVNASPSRPIPDGLADRFAAEFAAQRDGLRRLGLTAPDSWG